MRKSKSPSSRRYECRTKTELVKIARKRGLSSTDANRLRKDELINFLRQARSPSKSIQALRMAKLAQEFRPTSGAAYVASPLRSASPSRGTRVNLSTSVPLDRQTPEEKTQSTSSSERSFPNLADFRFG
jgi:hypothetical protein